MASPEFLQNEKKTTACRNERREREREKKEEEMDNEIRRRGKKCSRDGVVKFL